MSIQHSHGQSRGDVVAKSSLLLVLPLPLQYDEEGKLLIESQAANGLERWVENFPKVTAACVLTPDAALKSRSTLTWRKVEELPCGDKVDVVPLPWAFKPLRFMSHYRATREVLRTLIQQADYLVFGICFLWGDWAALACLEAKRQGRPYAVWTDVVDYQNLRWAAEKKPLLRRIYEKHLLANALRGYHHYLIRKSSLGLFHGMDCFRAYLPYSRNPHVVHNIHLKKSDSITPEHLEAKAAEVRHGAKLRIGYAGRADNSKGAADWIEAIKSLLDQGVDVEATWLGDGPALGTMRETVRTMGLAARIQLPGYESDHRKVLKFLENLHVLMFCHKTLESPRILIESLVCGTPIVGYDSPYPRDLLGELDCGTLTPKDDILALAAAVAHLDRHRDELARKIMSTAAMSETYNDEAVFRHRSEIIIKYL